MALLTAPGFGLEECAREAILILLQGLNTEIDTISAAWATRDGAFNTALQLPYNTTTVEHIETTGFHLGHKPSLIEGPPENFPSISVIGDRAIPAVDQGDQYVGYAQRMAVEVMVKALGENAEDIVNRRVFRTLEATNNVLLRNRTLNGLVTEITLTPTVVVTDCFKRREKSGHGDTWFWQGARIEYEVVKNATFF